MVDEEIEDADQNDAAQAPELPKIDPATGAKVFMKARILKDQKGFHKLVYTESVSQVNNLIESLVNRGKENQFAKKNAGGAVTAPAAKTGAAQAAASTNGK